MEIETKLVRGRALLEETIDRRGRARAQLTEIEGKAAPADEQDRTGGKDTPSEAPAKSSETKGASPPQAAPEAPPADESAP